MGFFISSFSSWFRCKVRLFIWFSPVSWSKLVILWTFPLVLLLLNPIGFGLSCFLFHFFVCIFWFPFLFLPWFVGYSEVCCFSSICLYFNSFFPVSQFSHSVVSDSLQPMNLSTPGLPVHHQFPEFTQTHVHRVWCPPAVSSSVVPFPSCPQSLPASESFPMSQFFAWGGQSTGVSALASFLPKKSQGWSPSEWTGWISLQSKRLSRVFSNTTSQKHQFFGTQLSSQSNFHIHTWPLEKP